MNETRIYITVRVDQGVNGGALNLSHEFRTLQPISLEKTAILLQKFSELTRAIESGKSIEWIEKGGQL